MSIPTMIQLSSERFAHRPAVADGTKTLTYVELIFEVKRAARSLLALGVEHGDTVAVWAPNMWEWIVSALAVHSVGGALIPINTRFKGAEAAYVLSKSRSRILFTVSSFLGTDYVRALTTSGVALPHLQKIVVLRGDTSSAAINWEAFLELGTRIQSDVAEKRAAAVRGDDLSDIIFTSGTTGHPKGVMCSHDQTLRAFRSWSETVGLREGDRYLVVLPFFHSFGYKAGWLASLMMGATVLPQATFDVDAVLERVARDRVTVLPGPPSLYQSILAHADRSKYDLSSLRLAVTGAAAIPVELIHRMRRDLTFDTIITGYGLTESSGVCTMCRFDDDPETIATTSGRAIDGLEVIVANDAGSELPRGEAGEVLVRGYAVTRGYFEDPEETNRAVDAHGWLHTGDIGVMNERGYLRITDRKKDMFIVGGFNAYPAEIESALLEHEAIAQVAVVGMPDERLGEVGMAFVVMRPGTKVSSDELIAWSRSRMANYKVPRRFEFVRELPMNATGKVLKFKLREIAARH